MKLLPSLLRQVVAYCIKCFKTRYVYLAQLYGTAIQPVPFDEAFHEKGLCYIISIASKTDSKHQECCVAENAPQKYICPYAEFMVFFAKTFEFQPGLEQEGGFGTQPYLITADQNKHKPLLPPPSVMYFI